MSKFYNVVVKKVIPDSKEKAIYHKVGTVKITKNGGWFLQMYHQPHTEFMIFPNHNETLPVIEFTDHEA